MMVLWNLMRVTAHLGLGDEMLVPIQVKPQTAKEAVNTLEAIRTPGNCLQYVVDSFDKAAIGVSVEIVGNHFQVIAQGLEKSVKTSQHATPRLQRCILE